MVYRRAAMTTQRRNAPYAAALIIPFCGCLSDEETLFSPVDVPEMAPTLAPGTNPSQPDAQRAPAAPAGDAEELPEVVLPSNPSAAANAGEEAPLPALDAEADPAAPPRAPVGSCDARGLFLCDDFEATAPGLFPSSEPWLAELPGCGSHGVQESAMSRSGARALRAGVGGYPECMLHAELSAESPVYVRSWIRLDAGARSQNYISLVELGPREDRDDPELRIGVRSAADSLCPGVPGVDVSIGGLGGGPRTECSGVVLEAERWYCFQARLAMQERRLEVSLDIDGEPAVEGEYTGLDAAWSARQLYLKVGRASYGGSPAGSVWHDDVALGAKPIPCEP